MLTMAILCINSCTQDVLNLTLFHGTGRILLPLHHWLTIWIKHWGSSTVQVNFIQEKRHEKVASKSFQVYIQLRFTKALKTTGGKTWEKTHEFYLHVNSRQRGEFLFSALLGGPRTMPGTRRPHSC